MSVRVVRASASGASPSSQGPASRDAWAPMLTARKIHAAAYEAKLEGERAIAEARRQAEAIVARAHAQAAAIEEQTRARALDQSRAEAIAILALARAEELALVDRATDVVVTAARAVAERALCRALREDDGALLDWARQALLPLRAARRVHVRGSRATIARLAAAVSQLAPAPSAIELEVDPALEDDALVARSDLGDVSLDVRSQAGALIEVLRAALLDTVRARGVR